MKRFLVASSIVLALLLACSVILDKTYLLKAFRVTYLRGNTDATIYDFKVQPTRAIETGTPQPWESHEDYNEVELSDKIQKWHEELRSIAYLVVKDGKILTEHYYREGGPKHMSSTWSITKTYTSLLLLKAVDDGLITSIDDPVSKYIPEWDIEQGETLTLRHLASMSAGLYWDEWAHTPLALITKMNFYNDLEKFTLNDMYAIGDPGEIQHYNSGGTQILGTVLDRVLSDRPISDYLSDKFWKPLGYTQNGLFILDSELEANEKTYGGIVSNARDVSRLGQLILNDGVWDGDTILGHSDMALIKTIPYNNTTYSYGMWTGTYEGQPYYVQVGFRGQYCIAFPAHGLVITRLGHEAESRDDIEQLSPDMDLLIEEALRISSKSSA